MKTTFYFIEDHNGQFKTLAELRWHIHVMCTSDQKTFEGRAVYKVYYVNGELEGDDDWMRVINIQGNKVVLSKSETYSKHYYTNFYLKSNF